MQTHEKDASSNTRSTWVTIQTVKGTVSVSNWVLKHLYSCCIKGIISHKMEKKSNLAEGFTAVRSVSRALGKSLKRKIARNCISCKKLLWLWELMGTWHTVCHTSFTCSKFISLNICKMFIYLLFPSPFLSTTPSNQVVSIFLFHFFFPFPGSICCCSLW